MSDVSTNNKSRTPLPPPPPPPIDKYDEYSTIQKLKEVEDSLITYTFEKYSNMTIDPSSMSALDRRILISYIRTNDKDNARAFVNIYESGWFDYYNPRFSATQNEDAMTFNSHYDTVKPNYDEDEDEDEDENERAERRSQAKAEAEASSFNKTVERINNNLHMIEMLGTCFLSPEWIDALMYKGRTKPYEWALVKEHYERDPESFHYDDGKPMCDEDGEFILDESGNFVYQNVLNLNGLLSGEGLERK
jgi:hypothetical protein